MDGRSFVDTAVRCVPIERDISLIGVVREPTKMSTPRILAIFAISFLVVTSGCKLPTCNFSSCNLFQRAGVGCDRVRNLRHRINPFKRFRAQRPLQPGFETIACESCNSPVEHLDGGNCQACQEALGFLPQTQQLQQQYPIQNQLPPAQYEIPSTTVPAPIQNLGAPSTNEFQIEAEEFTAPGNLEAPSIDVDQGAFYRTNSLEHSRRSGNVNDILRRAELARQERLQNANSVIEQNPEAVSGTVPTRLPKLKAEKASAPLENQLPKIKNLAEAESESVTQVTEEPKKTEAKEEVEIKSETIAATNDANNEFDLPKVKTPEVKTVETEKPTPAVQETVQVEEPVIPQKPFRSEEEIVRELRNSTVPHSVVFDSSPIIPEQNIPRALKSPAPKSVPGNGEIVLRARPVKTLFSPAQTEQVAVDIAPPPALRVAELRPRPKNVEPQPNVEYVAQREPQMMQPRRIPMLQASATQRVDIEEVLEQPPRYTIEPLPQPHFVVEPLPLADDVYLSPEGLPLEQISDKPLSASGVPTSDRLPEFSSLPQVEQVVVQPAEVQPVETTSKREILVLKAQVNQELISKSQALPAAKVKSHPRQEVLQQNEVLQRDEILRLRAAPTGNGDVYRNTSSAAKIRIMKPRYQYYNRERQQIQREHNAPEIQLPTQQRGQPIFDYDRIKDEVNRLSKRPRPTEIQDR